MRNAQNKGQEQTMKKVQLVTTPVSELRGETLINIDGLIQLCRNAPNQERAMEILQAMERECPDQYREAELRLLQGKPEIQITIA